MMVQVLGTRMLRRWRASTEQAVARRWKGRVDQARSAPAALLTDCHRAAS